ncbi:MAG TPA: response regulator [Caulobacteraceae bacterium]|jgi:CheY-like chemotaxis protein
MALVLVVDDDPVFREIATEMLRQAGYQVRQAENGRVATERAMPAAPDLAVVDMLMPERDGIETIGDLKTRWPGVRIIAVSSGGRGALDAGVLLRAAKALGADAALEKPLNHDTFLGLVRSLVG